MTFPTSGFSLPWEEEGWEYPPSFAPPLQVAVEASNGASDYGNKFGEPVLAGEKHVVLLNLTSEKSGITVNTFEVLAGEVV